MSNSPRPVAWDASSSDMVSSDMVSSDIVSSGESSSDMVQLPIGALTVMGAAVFTAIATEVLPVGLLPLMSQGLGVTQARIGLLVSTYAVAVAVASIP